MSIDNLIELVSYDNFEIYFNIIDLDNLKVYITENFNYFIGLTDQFGVLFLPDLTGKLDCQQGILFHDSKSIHWIEEWVNQIRKKAKLRKISKDIFKNKEKILEYLNLLKKEN